MFQRHQKIIGSLIRGRTGTAILQLVHNLASKPVQSPSLPLQGVNDIHGRDSLPPRVLGVCYCVANHVLEEYLQYSAGLLVDQSADTLHTAPASQAANRGLGDALDVVAEDLRALLAASL
jgi:hypothetical protein